jgi:rhamnose utilization protein RhaD (predicted bifunctional aldolase and dehydrogenase)/NAD(P)-dependent dehydrogenase (short-subunit alcohol dehydrogenase family)
MPPAAHTRIVTVTYATPITPQWPSFSAQEDALDTLVKLSRYYGQCPGFVIAGGGNTSCKADDTLFVKASGTQLATISRDGFVGLDRRKLQDLADTQLASDPQQREAQFKDAVLAARLEPEKGQRPSVEALLHHLLPEKFVVHSHATLVNTLTCCRNGEKIAREMLGNDVLWIPFVDPGYVLARLLKELLVSYQAATNCVAPKIILMANHGLIVSGNTPQEIRSTTDELTSKIALRLGGNWQTDAFGAPVRAGNAELLVNTLGPSLRGLLSEGDKLKVVTFDDSPLVMSFVGTNAAQTLPFEGPVNPDQIVYCNSFPLYWEPTEDAPPTDMVESLRAAVAAHRQTNGYLPRVVLVKGLGLFGVGDDYRAAATARDLYKDAIEILTGATQLGGPTFLSIPHRKFIEQWEVEAYRKQVAKGSAKAGRVAGKVAVVTGAAQGFGLEIAQAFAAQGGTVVLTDINEEGAKAAAAEICKAHGAGRAMGLPINVTSGQSIGACMHQVVRMYGGFDVLISNAGVLKAESVKLQSESDFEFVTAVNYKGYFFCVQKAAGILALQHQARPEYMSDIIQINSKSGLQGSNKNGAYAGSKFGGIGLTQSFALELIADGIKVNAICPGNFFDGPLWSDPDTGLFAQYLRTGKVPGATTVANVKKFYEAKVPMGRGCTTADVMTTVFYLIDQKYETGQAMPVTGGQVMLS